MVLLFGSFLAGMLTILAPCILPFIPVIVGGGITTDTRRNFLRPLVIVISLALSVIVFSLLLKATTSLLGVPQMVWQIVSGILVILIGINFIFPVLWDNLVLRTGFALRSNKQLGVASAHHGIGGAILIGSALGPVFSSCSPTYALIVAVIVPTSFGLGLLNLVAYALGMSTVLFVVIYAGQRLIRRLGWVMNPHGLFRKIIGVIFIIVGIAVVCGLDKVAQASLLETGVYDGISQFESRFEQR